MLLNPPNLSRKSPCKNNGLCPHIVSSLSNHKQVEFFLGDNLNIDFCFILKPWSNIILSELISIIVPVYNEEESLIELEGKIAATVEKINEYDYEILFIDDGSIDKSWHIIQQLQKANPGHIRSYSFGSNRGKSDALNLGFSEANGSIVFTIDADLQDDPSEIPRFIETLNSGYDVVSGWKRNRQDPLNKTFPSKIFNKLVSLLTGLNLNDFNCGFKAYRKKLVEDLTIYGEQHRFIPVLAHHRGFRVTEIPVTHHARKYGFSKYGWKRFIKGFLDLLTILLLTKFLSRPAHLFGGIGILFGMIGFIILAYLSSLWFFGYSLSNRPLLFLGILLLILGIQMITFGLLSELITFHSTKQDLRKFLKE